MIDFELSDEQKQFQSLARDFTREHVIPVAAEHDRAETFPERVIEAAHDVGLLNVGVPEAVGGLGLGMVDEVIIGEEIAYGCMGIFTILMASELGITPLLLAGTSEQHERFLAPLLQGPRLAAFALSEPNNGSDAGAMTTRAEIRGDEVVLNGVKTWISNGGIADVTVVFASFDPELRHRGTLAVVVEGGTPGLTSNKLPASTPGSPSPVMTAANAAAPAPSRTMRWRAYACRIASAMADSGTSTVWSTSSCAALSVNRLSLPSPP